MIDHLLSRLRSQGNRVTPVIKSVVSCMHKCQAAKTVNELKALIVVELGYSMPDSTIYRICERLVSAGFFFAMPGTDGIGRYFLCTEPEHSEHQHFICKCCHKVQEIPVTYNNCFNKEFEKQIQGTIDKNRIHFEGVCSLCKK
jgi:Fur family transcriptional regulator, ferric uptake regulator